MRFSVADLSTTLLVLSNLGSSFADCNNPIVRKEWYGNKLLIVPINVLT